MIIFKICHCKYLSLQKPKTSKTDRIRNSRIFMCGPKIEEMIHLEIVYKLIVIKKISKKLTLLSNTYKKILFNTNVRSQCG